MTRINAYLNFNGNCSEAMTFYRDCLGGELVLQTVKGTPMEAQCPAGKEHEIMHSSLTGDGFVLMASDMLGQGGYQQGTNFSLTVNCSSEEQIHSLFGKLAEGGQVFMPLGEQFWGALFGGLADKFGTRWMLNYDKPKQA
ncbi:MAG TPA: VOC family protein [Flavisolibacter sp.]